MDQISIAKVLSRKRKTRDRGGVLTKSFDDEIAALERELAVGDEGSDDSETDDAIADDIATRQMLVEKGEDGRPIKLVSKSLLKHRIAPLPQSLLPSATCGKSSHGADKKSSASSSAGGVHTTSKVRFSDDEQKSKELEKKATVVAPMSGAEKTIREMLRNYKPSSIDKKPFWCRVCQFQSVDEPSLMEHRETENHKLAVDIEMKMCFCKLCRKQFTSIEQLKEHLKGRNHAERLKTCQQQTKFTR